MFADAFAAAPGTLVCYSVKANSNLGVLATLARLGAGMDVVSEGELRRALAVRVPPELIVFSGVGKTREEMAFALDAGIFAFNVESEAELRALSEVAAARGATARIAVRVNPDVDAKTHHKIATGKAENKFGVPFAEALALYALGEPAAGYRPVRRAYAYRQSDHRACAVQERLRAVARAGRQLARGGFAIEFVNLGGGLGVPYRSDQARAAAAGGLCAGWCRTSRRPRRAASVRAGPHDRRQCRRPGVARALREARRVQDLHHRRRGDERFDAARRCTRPITRSCR